MDYTELKSFMQQLTDWVIPGNSIAIYRENKKIFSCQTGYADLENNIPMREDHLFNGYSVTKVLTVTAGMQLYEKGLFLLDEPLYAYLPEYRYMNIKAPDGSIRPAESPITLRQLFTMTAGFNYQVDVPAIKKARELTGGRMDTRTVIRCLAEEPLDFEPGTRWQYGLGHDVLAAVLEIISGKRFSLYVKENILDPIGMADTVFHNEAVRDRLAAQYQCVNPQGAAVQPFVRPAVERVERVSKRSMYVFGPEYDSGGAGITTSVDDYARFASMLANGGVAPNGERILSSAAIDLMRTDQLSEKLRKDFCWATMRGYGYGLGVRTLTDPAAGGLLSPAGEFGWDGAAGAYLLADPKNRLAVFYAQHMLNPQEKYFQPRLRNVVYSCMD